jgi:hypothetical protein
MASYYAIRSTGKETAQKEDKEEDRNASPSPDLWGRHAGGGAVYCAA